jgi:hypothetical protein
MERMQLPYLSGGGNLPFARVRRKAEPICHVHLVEQLDKRYRRALAPSVDNKFSHILPRRCCILI